MQQIQVTALKCQNPIANSRVNDFVIMNVALTFQRANPDQVFLWQIFTIPITFLLVFLQKFLINGGKCRMILRMQWREVSGSAQ